MSGTGTSWVCPCKYTCSVSCPSASKLQRHLQSCDKIKDDISWVCPLKVLDINCAEEFKSIKDVLQHIEGHASKWTMKRSQKSFDCDDASSFTTPAPKKRKENSEYSIDNSSLSNIIDDCTPSASLMGLSTPSDILKVSSVFPSLVLEEDDNGNDEDDDVKRLLDFVDDAEDESGKSFIFEGDDWHDVEFDEIDFDDAEDQKVAMTDTNVEPIPKFVPEGIDLSAEERSISADIPYFARATSRSTFRHTFNVWQFRQSLQSSKDKEKVMKAIEMYLFAINNCMTRECYLDLMMLEVFQNHPSYPPSIQTLTNRVTSGLKNYVDFHSIATVTVPPTEKHRNYSHGADIKAPYQTLMRCIESMLLDSRPTSIRNSVREHMKKHLGDVPIETIGALEKLQQAQLLKMNSEDEDYVFDDVGSGTLYLQNLIDTRPLWSSNVMEATKAKMETLVLSLAIYEDGFTYNKGSRVKQILFMVQLQEAPAVGAHMTSLRLQLLMIAEGHAHGIVGSDPFWKLYTSEIEELARGKVFTFYDSSGSPEDILVLAFVLQYHGDIPAGKGMMGYSTSSTVENPCVYCYTSVRSFGSTNAVSRNRDAVNPHWNQDRLGSIGMHYISELFKWPRHGSPWRLCPDTMHMLNLGTDVRFFLLIFQLLTKGLSKVVKTNIWVRMSEEFTSYCIRNKINGAFTKFTCWEHFKKLTAWSKKHFISVSGAIFDKLQVGNPNNPKHVLALNAWNRYVCVTRILQQHSINKADFKLLRSEIPKILDYWLKTFPATIVKGTSYHSKTGVATTRETTVSGMFTLKAHFFIHLLELIKLHGPPRSWSNYSKEGMIGILKKIYRNTNWINREVTVFDRYRILLFWEVFASILGLSNKNVLRQWDLKCVSCDERLAPNYFSSYTRVTIVNIDGEVVTCLGSDFRYHKELLRATVSFSIFNYHGVRENDCILLRAIPQVDDFNCAHAGFFKDVLLCEGNIYITYELPAHDEENNMMYKTMGDDYDDEDGEDDTLLLMRHEVSTARIPVLHIVPLQTCFISKLHLYRIETDKHAVIH